MRSGDRIVEGLVCHDTKNWLYDDRVMKTRLIEKKPRKKTKENNGSRIVGAIHDPKALRARPSLIKAYR